MAALESDCSLPLFQSSHSLHSNPTFDENVQMINNMIELNYITSGSEGLRFTNAGIEYMMKKFREFRDNMDSHNVDDTMVYALSGSKPHDKKQGKDMLKEFKTSNLLIQNESDEVDYNNMRFKKKAQDALEPGIDGIDKPK
jgi:hypothetical protein